MTRFGLIRAELARDWLRVLGLSLAIALGVAAAALVLGLEQDARQFLGLWAPISDRSLTVEPPSFTLGGMGGRLDDAALSRLRLLPHVERAIPRMLLRVPALSEYRGPFFGQHLELTIEIAAEGVDEAAMASALFPGETFAWRVGQPIPFCIGEGLVALYNSVFAPARSLPPLDARLLRGFELPISVGASMVGPRRSSTETLSARLVCVSPDAMLAGLTVPLAAARELNRRNGVDDEDYSSVTLVAPTVGELPALEKTVVELGFHVGAGQGTGRRLGRAVWLASLMLLIAVALLLALAATLVAVAIYGTLRARSGELRLLNALGATPGFLLLQAVAEALCIGLAGAFIGLAVAAALGPVMDAVARNAGLALPIRLGRLGWSSALYAAITGQVAAVSGAVMAVYQMRRQLT